MLINFDEAIAALTLTADTDNNSMYVRLGCHTGNIRTIVIGGDTGGKKNYFKWGWTDTHVQTQKAGKNGGCGTWYKTSKRHTVTHTYCQPSGV